MAQETQIGALYQPRGVGWGEDVSEVQKGGDICIPMADFMLRCDRKQQNSVKQLSFNKKIKKKKKNMKGKKKLSGTFESYFCLIADCSYFDAPPNPHSQNFKKPRP